MSRCATLVILVSAVLSAFVLSGAAPSSASLYTITATPMSSGLSGFTLTYNDVDNDTPVPLFGPQEGDTVDAFSGVTWAGKLYDIVSAAPMYETNLSGPTFTDGIGAPGAPNSWFFTQSGSTGTLPIGDLAWTYEQAPAVPIPSAVLLLGSGLMGLGAWRRFRKG